MRLLVLLFLTSACAAQDVDHLIRLLNDDDFDIREEATEKLGHLHRNYACKLYRLSFVVEPEVRIRLRRAVHQIVERQIIQKDDRWLRLHGAIGVEYESIYPDPPDTAVGRGGGGSEQEYRAYYQWYRDRKAIGYKVSWIKIDSPAEDKLFWHDTIIEIDGRSITNVENDTLSTYGWLKLGKTLTLKVKRYKNHEKFDETHTPGPTDPTEEVIVKLTPTTKPDYEINWSSDIALRALLHEQFLNDHRPTWIDISAKAWARRIFK